MRPVYSFFAEMSTDRHTGKSGRIYYGVHAFSQNPIGVFDSGVGGLTTLEALIGELPRENFLYLADFSHAPYGDKDREQIAQRVFACADTLLGEGAKAVVAACNTATAAGIAGLRAARGIPVIGAEPALKPACSLSGVKSVLVMLTPAASRQPKFRDLIAAFPDKRIELLTLPFLATEIERHLFDAGALRAVAFAALSNAPRCDAVVLGCTHYVFLRPYVEEFFGGTVPVFDGNAGIARRTRTLLARAQLLNPCGSGRVRFLTL